MTASEGCCLRRAAYQISGFVQEDFLQKDVAEFGAARTNTDKF